MTIIAVSQPVASFRFAQLDEKEMVRLLRWMEWGVLVTTEQSAAWVKRGVTLLYLLGMADYTHIGLKQVSRLWNLTGKGETELQRLERLGL